MRENRTQKSDADSGRSAKPDVSRVLTEYRGLLCYIIRPIVGDENLIEDCFSEISEIIIQKYDAYYDEIQGAVSRDLCRYAGNIAMRYFRNKKKSLLVYQSMRRDFFVGFEKVSCIIEQRDRKEGGRCERTGHKNQMRTAEEAQSRTYRVS